MLELKILGQAISDEQIKRARKTIENKANVRKKAKLKKKQTEFNEFYSNSDETFSYIAGYTSGGAPYGVTWDEVNEESSDNNQFTGDWA